MDAVTYMKHARRKTVTMMDVIYALKRHGRTRYGQWLGLGFVGLGILCKDLEVDLANMQKKKEEEKALKELKAKAGQKGTFGGLVRGLPDWDGTAVVKDDLKRSPESWNSPITTLNGATTVDCCDMGKFRGPFHDHVGASRSPKQEKQR
ncbi:hypothetical protein Sjap_011374 [Stephania japonica]|uniref:Histone H4 n=1 Tax=Stephania japonica TaxID=461633 RepID=A0AAP0JB01_9MAGN